MSEVVVAPEPVLGLGVDAIQARHEQQVRLTSQLAVCFSTISIVGLAAEAVLALIAAAKPLSAPWQNVLGVAHALYFFSLLCGLCLGLRQWRTRKGKMAIILALLSMLPAVVYLYSGAGVRGR